MRGNPAAYNPAGGERQMKILRIACGVMAAMIGAGFASGREIMAFFTRWGRGSWPILLASAGSAVWMMDRVMGVPSVRDLLPRGKGAFLGQGILLMLFFCVAGAMAAAAGELAALTVPLRHARSAGMLLTLALCMALKGHSLAALKAMGYILLPLILLAWVLILRLPAEAAEVPAEPGNILLGILPALCYSAMNVMLSTGVLCEAGQMCSDKECTLAAVGTGCLLMALLGLGNFALLPHRAALIDAPLPTVVLLRSYGKTGFYLSAAVLYLAVVSTQIAVLRGIDALFPKRLSRRKTEICFLLIAALSLCGFGGIVGSAYPLAGGFSLVCLMGKQKTGEGKSPSPA